MSVVIASSDPPDLDLTPTSMDIDEPGPSVGTTSLKRAASAHFDDMLEDRRKRLRECEDSDDDEQSDFAIEGDYEPFAPHDDDEVHATVVHHKSFEGDDIADRAPDGGAESLVDELALELNCGCCTEICYNPVLVAPCQHTFCGSCFTLWIQNGGSNCPACRTVSTSVTPARPLQKIIEILVKHAPMKARTDREKAQADEVYKAGSTIRLPSPKQPSPEPNVSQSGTYARPCPHCVPGNQWGWRCPIPIPDPIASPDNAISLDDGVPVGHAYCGNCDHLHALAAPTSSKCDFCLVSFCGIGVPGRCAALSLASQHPQGFADLSDLLQAVELYEVFADNTYEVDLLVDYLREKNISPRAIYVEMVTHLASTPRGFATLISSGLFSDARGSGNVDPEPSAPRRKICRDCAGEIFVASLMPWWILERQKGHLDPRITGRPDCKNGARCETQSDIEHAKEFNHVIALQESNAPEGDGATGPTPPEDHHPDAVHASTAAASVQGFQLSQYAGSSATAGGYAESGQVGCILTGDVVSPLMDANNASKLMALPEASGSVQAVAGLLVHSLE